HLSRVFASAHVTPKNNQTKKNPAVPRLLEMVEQTRQRLYTARNEAERLLISQKLDVLINKYYRMIKQEHS
ncbi:MAG: aspartyl-phosphate phosphatase Spo0E family protein, partial [Firmicutes bacterium]|nr:aspartyl-phosphate phosphatase Spo0E family protein [Bacillota bacterium]